MSLAVKFVRKWEYFEDPEGNAVRHIPAGIVLELTDDVAAAAIYDGAAEPTGGEIPPDVQRHIDAYAEMVRDMEAGASFDQALENMASTLQAAGGEAGDGETETSDDADPNGDRTVDPVDPETGEVKPKPKATKKAR